jgi:prepilin-type N-terminal cleavage/methylation domain-containing protein
LRARVRARNSSLTRRPVTRAASNAPLGFTLIELLSVLALISVLTAIAGPPLSGLATSRGLDSMASNIGSAVRRARSESVKRAARVVVEPRTQGAWTGALRVYADEDGNPVDEMQVSDTLIRTFEQSSPITTVSAPARIALDPQGYNRALVSGGGLAVSTLVLCSSGRTLTLTVDRSGVVTVATMSSDC